MIATRLLMGGGASLVLPQLLAPSGSRVQLSTNDYQAFPMLMLENTDDLRLLYRNGTEHNSPGATIDMMVSTDLGVTWPGSADILVTATGMNDVRSGPVMQSSTGRYIWGFNRRNPYNSFDISAVIRYTDDDWATQSSDYFPPAYSGPLTSVIDGSIFEHAGEIILPGFAQISSGVEFCVIWRSSDDGETFASPEIIAQDGSIDFQEPIIRVLDSGRWLCLMRSESNHHTWRTYSDDDGATWSTPDDVNEMTGTPVFIEYLPGCLIQFGRYLTSGDSPGFYALSFNDGATWTTPLEVDPGETALWQSAGVVVSSPGVVKMVYALELTPSVARRYFRTFA